MLNRVYNFLSSMKFAALMLLLFAFASGYATFIERDFGTASANALIYRAWWFELIQILLCVSLVLNMIKFKLFRKEKLATLSFHLSFVLIIIGAGVTRYIGYEGRMQIYTNEEENNFMSDNMFLQVDVHDKKKQLKFDKQLNLSSITRKFDKTPILNKLFSNYFEINTNFFENFSKPSLSEDFSIEYVDFISNSINTKISGVILTSSNNSSKSGTAVSVDEFADIKIGNNSSSKIRNITFSLNKKQDSAVNLILNSSSPLNTKIGCSSDIYDIVVKTMPPDPNDVGSYKPRGTYFEIEKMSLITIKENITDSIGKNIIFRDFYFEDTVMYSSSNNMDMRENPYRTKDALVVDVKVNNKIKRDTLIGSPGTQSKPSVFKFENLFFTLSYGPKYYQLPFSVKLDKAKTKNYPGSKNPSSYMSHVTVKSPKEVFSDSIYMNNILNYKGYRFYQASIGKQDEFTVLSVNKDWLGTLISYVGYFFLALGMVMVFFSQKTRFKNLTRRLNNLKRISILIFIFFNGISAEAHSNINKSDNLSEKEYTLIEEARYVNLLEKYEINQSHAEKFDRLLVQHAGRIKPMSTYSMEIIRKFSRKDEIYDLSPSQSILGIMCFPHVWNHIPIFKVEHQQIIREINYLKKSTELITDAYRSLGRFPLDILVEIESEKLSKKIQSDYNHLSWEAVQFAFKNGVKKIGSNTKEVPQFEEWLRSVNKQVKLGKYSLNNQKVISKIDYKEEMFSYSQIIKVVTYEKYEKAFAKLDIEKSKLDKEILRLTDRRYIYEQITKQYGFSNLLFNFFPQKNDLKWKPYILSDSLSGKIVPESFFNASQRKEGKAKEIKDKYTNEIIDVFYALALKERADFLALYTYHLRESHKMDNYSISDNILSFMVEYQNKNGSNLIPAKWKIDLEILYNNINIFHQLFKLYFFAGLFSLVLVILSMFYSKKWIQKSIVFFKWIILSGFILHTLGLISRWIISNHAPWTNGYEAMIYTVWATMLAAIIFSKKSALTLATTTLVSSMLLLFAFISSLDPTITNVVPVLNSYWLMIHVSIIVASYGFLIMGGFLGLLCILLILFKTLKSKNIIDYNISKLTIINEKSLMIGLFMLTIGTFLGGVWANESWGRYWGWDAKETWALVSILAYAFILHMRFIPSLKSKFAFNVASMFAVFSVLMTYFGVNYLLSGLHSYAAADEKVTIPNYIYITFGCLVLLSVLANIKQRYLDKIEMKISDKK